MPRSAAQRLLLLAGSLGPIGHLPGSGTFAVALVGIPAAFVMTTRWSSGVYACVVAAFSLLAVGVHQVGDRLLGEKDSRKLVWDELVGFFIAAVAIPKPWAWRWLLTTFILQRAIDIYKVPPAGWIERHVPGGWGDVADDVLAGGYTMLLVGALRSWYGVEVN